jgi:hypothetical protein
MKVRILSGPQLQGGTFSGATVTMATFTKSRLYKVPQLQICGEGYHSSPLFFATYIHLSKVTFLFLFTIKKGNLYIHFLFFNLFFQPQIPLCSLYTTKIMEIFIV